MSTSPSLLTVIYNNDANLPAQVQDCIARGEDVSAVTEHSESPLRVASNNGRFEVVRLLLDAGADPAQLRWTPSFFQLAYGSIDELVTSLHEHGDIEARDFWQRTPLLMAILLGDIARAERLLALGADRTAVGRCGKPPLFYAIQHNDIAMLAWLLDQGFDIEATNEFADTALHIAAESGMTASVEFLLQRGVDIFRQNHIPYRAIEVASNLDIVWMLVDQGEDINDISDEMHAALTGTAVHAEPECSKQEYLASKHRRFGRSNPERNTPAFWRAMIVSGANAWRARRRFDDMDIRGEAIWCYERFGRSTTRLDDGRIIEIAGEHEDYYDPDFCIYNDVTCFGKDGAIEVFNYPAETFPPTDFHSATRVGDAIYIIGSLGYPDDRRPGQTPVFRLQLDSMQIERILTTGDSPGWISRHKARLLDGAGIEIRGGDVWADTADGPDLLENTRRYRLDLQDLVWHRLAD